MQQRRHRRSGGGLGPSQSPGRRPLALPVCCTAVARPRVALTCRCRRHPCRASSRAGRRLTRCAALAATWMCCTAAPTTCSAVAAARARARRPRAGQQQLTPRCRSWAPLRPWRCQALLELLLCKLPQPQLLEAHGPWRSLTGPNRLPIAAQKCRVSCTATHAFKADEQAQSSRPARAYSPPCSRAAGRRMAIAGGPPSARPHSMQRPPGGSHDG